MKIPANTTADIYLPVAPNASVFEGGKKLSAQARENVFIVQVRSGAYDFEVK